MLKYSNIPVLAERIFHAGRITRIWKRLRKKKQNGSGAASRLLIFTKKISKTAPEAASWLRQKIQQIARSASTAALPFKD